jgi:hypothetical protein
MQLDSIVNARRTQFMMRCIALIGILGLFSSIPILSQADDTPPEKKYEDFTKLTAGAKSFDGLFKMYQKDENLFAEIQPNQFERPFLAPISIAKGLGMGGYTLNFDEQWVVIFRRVGDKVFLIRRNVRFQAKKDSPVARAVETTYSDSVLLSLKIRSINPMKNSVVVDFGDIFLRNFAELPYGMLDRDRTTWNKVKAFPRNVEIQVAATFSGGMGLNDGMGDEPSIDSRGNTVIIHYSLVELPEGGYQPRLADDRVGYFLTAVKDFSSDSKDTAFVRHINRWRLERVDGSSWKEGAKLVPPKKKIVYWIEKSVPDEYRASVREGILEWNKAFEKVGFRDAIEVRQQESEDFDPEDCNYNTFRWIATDQGFAMGPSRANPFTGELIDADIIFDASMVRFYKQEHQLFQTPNGLTTQPVSPIQAAREGWGLPSKQQLALMRPGSWNDRLNRNPPDKSVKDANEEIRHRFEAYRQGFCQCGTHKSQQLGLAMTAMAVMQGAKPGDKLSDEMIQQAVKEVTMHEVGHTLGLRHNFKASTTLNNNQLHDQAITRKQGICGSVMDYAPVNLAPKGVKQGDYFSTTLGPYDYWAIEYGYKPLSGGTEGEVADLQKIASRCAEPGLQYSTDEDMMTSDPHVNVWDLGSDPLKYGMDQMALAEELLKGLADRVVEKGEGYQRSRLAFGLMINQYGNAANLATQYVGGEFMHRDHKGDPNGRDPMIPVKGNRQREALKLISDKILTDVPFNFQPELLRKLASERWLHWGSESAMYSGSDLQLYQMILSIQQIPLNSMLSASTLNRLQNLATKAEKDDQPLQIAEIFKTFSDAILSDLPVSGDKPATTKSSLIRRNLQRDYLGRLSRIVLGRSESSISFMNGMVMMSSNSVPPDARALARLHLRQTVQRIDLLMNDAKANLDDTTKAHWSEIKEQLTRVLSASLNAIAP